jgi:hypothetical protein
MNKSSDSSAAFQQAAVDWPCCRPSGMWFFGAPSSTAALGSFNDRSDFPGKMNNEAPQPTNEKTMLIINSGEHRNIVQWEASTGFTKWGIKSESRNILTATATASLALLLFPLHQPTFTRPITSISQYQSIQEPSLYHIVEEY